MNYLLLAAEPATIVFLVGLVISIALTATAAILAAKQKSKSNPSEPPPTTVLQGGYIPRVLGRRKVAPLVGAIGWRAVGSTRRGSGKSKGPRSFFFNEDGWHHLCIGPAYRLLRVWVDGQVVWTGPIDSDTTPSGSQIPGLPALIYWGEQDPPPAPDALNYMLCRDGTGANINQTFDTVFLNGGPLPGDSTEMPRWPYHCYVYWQQFLLGAQPIWPQIEYEIETRIQQPFGAVPAFEFEGGDGAVASAANEAADKFYAYPAKSPFSAGVTYPFWITGLVSRPSQTGAGGGGGAGVFWGTRRDNGGGNSSGFRLWFSQTALIAGIRPESGANVEASLVSAVYDAPLRFIAIFEDAGGGQLTVRLYTDETPAGATDTDTAGLTNALGTTSLGSWPFFGIPDPYYNTWVESWPYPNGGTLSGPGKLGELSLFKGTPPDAAQRTRIYDGEDPLLIGIENGNELAEHHAMDQDTGADDTTGSVGVMIEDGTPTYGPLVDPPPDWIEDGSFGFPGEIGGVNAAQAWWEIATAEFPHGVAGAGASYFRSGMGPKQLVDLQETFLAWAEECVTDVLACNVFVGAGDSADGGLAQIQQDYGVMVSWKPTLGKFVAQRIRASAPIEIPERANAGPLPEVQVPLMETPFDRIMFTYQDKDRKYAETVVTIDADGQASLFRVQRSTKTPLPTATDNITARKLTERRSQEDLPGNVGTDLVLLRNSVFLYPGLVVDISEIDPSLPARLRVLSVQPDQLTSEVKVNCIADNYGATASTFEGEAPVPGTPDSAAVAEDLQATFMELPVSLLPDRFTRIVILRIRAHDQITGANVYLSPDGTTFELNQDLPDIAAGGTLDEAILANAPYFIPEGPEFTVQGPDIAAVQDLSTSEAAWRAGQQLAIIGSEVFCLQKVTAIDADTYRLDGLLRARYGTHRVSHAMGDVVYIVTRGEMTGIDDAIMTPGQSLRVKPQPHTFSAEVDLGDVDTITKTLRGNGPVPPDPTCLRVVAPMNGVPVYHTTQDVTFRFNYTDNLISATGAGLQNAGVGVGTSPVYGTFEAQVYDDMDVLVATYDLGTDTEWVYANADIQSDLGGEEDFRVEIRNINGGFRSGPAELSITFA